MSRVYKGPQVSPFQEQCELFCLPKQAMDLYSVVGHVSFHHGNNSTSGWRDFADGNEPYMNYKQNREESVTR